jgi:cephalosporin-C deacetylase-like acetyl esterase
VVSWKGGNAPGAEVNYTLDKDGMPPVTQGKFILGAGAKTITGTLAEPGFLRCRVFIKGSNDKNMSAIAGAGFSPEKIAPSLPVPEDFDDFWKEQKARLKEIPYRPELTPVKSPSETIECFDVQIPCAPPRPVSGYFAKPVGAKARRLPAMLFVHGAGVRSSSLNEVVNAVKKYNVLAMDINAHGIPNGQSDSFYKNLSEGELKGYPSFGRESREKCYFLGMFLRLVRAMEFLTKQPEWDGKTLIVVGSSQGGGQAIAAAALDSRVTLISAGVPALCDHSGKIINRINGWPKLVPDIDKRPDSIVLDAARYFDAMNFAARVKATAIVSVGFIDSTCPPTSVYAAYNNLPGKKRLVIEPLMGHTGFPSLQRATAAAIVDHLQKQKRKRAVSIR